jgi:hypothetical protein
MWTIKDNSTDIITNEPLDTNKADDTGTSNATGNGIKN